ncbi:hypothetical protein [Burkholderia latens]|uniref:CS1 type fimbrial major subunit n=2 Tax=Burkholderia latens TaxID=488446 RepID=A0A6H9SYF9_9BURK|nr:hypothetical protein [Burkholderia latens]KAB0643431.1 hypothetical protein F7R21_07050 [Burkholderia latens]VWB13502.1 hypothetical protein BLA24064_00459 [Burkholderia latens]
MHQSIIRACLLGAVAIAGTAHAEVKEQSFEIKLSAEVPPVSVFEVKEEGGWDRAKPQELTWNAEKKKFDALTLKVNAKSTVGNVQVKFSSAEVPRLALKGDAEAYFEVGAKVGDKDVGTDAAEVVTKAEAAQGKSLDLVITPGEASDKIKNDVLAGTYEGTVPLMFESEID